MESPQNQSATAFSSDDLDAEVSAFNFLPDSEVPSSSRLRLPLVAVEAEEAGEAVFDCFTSFMSLESCALGVARGVDGRDCGTGANECFSISMSIEPNAVDQRRAKTRSALRETQQQS